MNTNVFGKTMGNMRNHKDMKLAASQETYTKYLMKPIFKDSYPFSKKLFAIRMGKTKIKMKKTVHLGLFVFESSKALMYKFYYDFMPPK